MRTKVMLGIGLTAGALAWAAKDPVIMTVGGIDVPKSEFEYLYHKNSQQQLEQQSLDDYAEIFKIYKLKVADALAAGIDTTEAFQKEYNGYVNELAAPFMVDSTEIRKYVAEAYERSLIEPEAIHIMLFKTGMDIEDRARYNALDSIRNLILNGADFGELAVEFSQDPGSNTETKRGRIGYVPSPRYPYAFETQMYKLKPGEISEITESAAGFHIIKGGNKRPAHGKVQAEHILINCNDRMDDEAQAAAKAKIDSIAAILKTNPERFNELAMQLSDDKGSGRNGGRLPLFGTGEMVPEFEEAAFAIADGEISEPVKSQFGWHIIHRLRSAALPSYKEAEPFLTSVVTNSHDERSTLMRDKYTKKLAKQYNGKENTPAIGSLRDYIKTHGLDSTAVAQIATDYTTMPIYTYGKGRVITGAKLADALKGANIHDPEFSVKEFNKRYDRLRYTELTNYRKELLAEDEPSYRHLLREFRDGSLLYEIGRQKVWDKASKDTEGLERFFEQHRSDYGWSEPKVKGFLIQATDDSVKTAIENRLPQLGTDSIVRTIRKEFAGKAQIDRVLVSKGTNPMIDFLVFGGEKANPANSKYTTYFMYDQRLITEPEDVNDVRGLVTSDYQNALEVEWVDELKAKYPVTVNEKVLRSVK